MHKRQKQFNPSGIKWPTAVDMPLNKTQTLEAVVIIFGLKKKFFSPPVNSLCLLLYPCIFKARMELNRFWAWVTELRLHWLNHLQRAQTLTKKNFLSMTAKCTCFLFWNLGKCRVPPLLSLLPVPLWPKMVDYEQKNTLQKQLSKKCKYEHRVIAIP